MMIKNNEQELIISKNNNDNDLWIIEYLKVPIGLLHPVSNKPYYYYYYYYYYYNNSYIWITVVVIVVVVTPIIPVERLYGGADSGNDNIVNDANILMLLLLLHSW